MFRIGGGATFVGCFLLPALARLPAGQSGPRYAVEIADDLEIERRLHDLTLDFGVVNAAAISRPLQLQPLGSSRLRLWVPKAMCRNEGQAVLALMDNRLPLVLPSLEPPTLNSAPFKDCQPRLVCTGFLEAKTALETESVAALLPDFLTPEQKAGKFLRVSVPGLDRAVFDFRLAWSPRLLRLNPHATRQRDFLIRSLAARLREREGG
jgi:DNA-binding transcriptional LysR family regulator